MDEQGFGEVWDVMVYGTGPNSDVLIAGIFAGPTSKQKNLVLVDGTTGNVIRWYNSPALADRRRGSRNGDPFRRAGGKGKMESSAVLAADLECSEGVAGALCHAEKILEGVLRIPPEANPHSLAGAERRAASPTCPL
jgi:hypothetical protein